MKSDNTLPNLDESAFDATKAVRRRMLGLGHATLAVFDPPSDRTGAGTARFLQRCTVADSTLTRPTSAIATAITGGHMVTIGDQRRMIVEFVILRTDDGSFYGLYEPQPPDVRTLLPELAVINLNRARASLTTPSGSTLLISSLTVDEVNNMIVLARTAESEEDKASVTEEPLEEIEIVFDDEE